MVEDGNTLTDGTGTDPRKIRWNRQGKFPYTLSSGTINEKPANRLAPRWVLHYSRASRRAREYWHIYCVGPSWECRKNWLDAIVIRLYTDDSLRAKTEMYTDDGLSKGCVGKMSRRYIQRRNGDHTMDFGYTCNMTDLHLQMKTAWL